MARINLLPWRAELREQKKKEFLTLVGEIAFVMALVVGTTHFYMSQIIGAQNQRNRVLQNEIKLVEEKIEEINELENTKRQLIARTRVIEQLQINRPEIVRRFNEVVVVIPEGLYLLSIKEKDNIWILNGHAQSNARVSSLMRKLEESSLFFNPRLEVIKTSNTPTGLYAREFTINTEIPTTEEDEDEKKRK